VEDGRLILGDCLKILPTLPKAEAIITDPPWTDYETGYYDASQWHRPIEWMSPEVYMPVIADVLKEGGAAIIWCNWRTFDEVRRASETAGLTTKNCIVWAKPNHTAGDLDGNLGNMHEMALFAVKGRWTRPGRREVNLWHEGHLFSRAHRDHPTEKPENLMRRCVTTITRPGDLVIDPFMGAGSTMVACVKLGRRYIGIEKDAGYFQDAERKVTEARLQPPLLPNHGFQLTAAPVGLWDMQDDSGAAAGEP